MMESVPRSEAGHCYNTAMVHLRIGNTLPTMGYLMIVLLHEQHRMNLSR